MIRTPKPKTARGRRILDDRAPKLVENTKKCVFVRGSTTSLAVTEALRDFYLLKKPHAIHLPRRHAIHPFDDLAPLHDMCRKHDSSLALVATHSKKRPDGLTFARLFDGEVLDMVEVGVSGWAGLDMFKVPKPPLGTRPLLVFSGPLFTSLPALRTLRSMLIDLYRGDAADHLAIPEGVQYVVTVTADPAFEPTEDGDGSGCRVHLRTYKTALKRVEGVKTLPRVELEEMGPRADMVVRRWREGDSDVMREAMKVPKEIKNQTAKTKNITHTPLGDRVGTVHMRSQQLNKLELRKMKAFKKTAASGRGSGKAVEGGSAAGAAVEAGEVAGAVVEASAKKGNPGAKGKGKRAAEGGDAGVKKRKKA
ncbi:Brix-domain-containing protein [Gonapodya prolifera JEL478]|uniref:Ribosome production factor 2 homolog n=1 Tax=Gonapodya prolifera (strain JEL478) TaxID=1344416 RepID=A0A139APH1_GONPJ|nr:Brix-domain-containing protein [Gonapodya prolifera JEL478]|eukprot:KXS18622.1 Brix-domain-containing protein [Gonapodya prolifera JEL478]